MAKYTDILKRIKSLHKYVSPWAGTVYRSCTVEYSQQDDLLTGIGASNSGGRWNPKGIKAVYASFTPATGMAEVLGAAKYFGLDASSLMPRVFVGMRVSFAKVLDLTIGEARQRLGVSLQRMLTEDWHKTQFAGHEALTQQIGRVAMETGLEAIIVVSRLHAALASVVKEEAIGEWFGKPNPAFDGLKPLEVVERGEEDRIWEMIYQLSSGVAS